MEIRTMTPADRESVIAIADALPEWFNEDGRRNIRVDALFQHGLVACTPEITGFILYFVNEGVAHIGWMGVLRSHQRKGVGRTLLADLEARMRKAGAQSMQVHTLGDGVEYEPYVGTRAFYRAMGYTTLRVERHPENPGCPESLYLQKLLAG